MRKRRNVLVFLLSSLVLFACGNRSEPDHQLSQLYISALDVLVETDPGLNSGMAFIAIDMSNFEDVDEEEKEEIKAFFREKYAVEVLEATFEELQEQGRFDEETLSLDGILLAIQTVAFGDEVRMEGSKYRSGLGAIGMEIILHKPADEWEVKESRMLWISQSPTPAKSRV